MIERVYNLLGHRPMQTTVHKGIVIAIFFRVKYEIILKNIEKQTSTPIRFKTVDQSLDKIFVGYRTKNRRFVFRRVVQSRKSNKVSRLFAVSCVMFNFRDGQFFLRTKRFVETFVEVSKRNASLENRGKIKIDITRERVRKFCADTVSAQ